MKTFKDYLTESKRTYSFRIKIANCDVDADMLDHMERAMSAYHLSDITKPKSGPITRYKEFYNLGPVSCQMVDVVTHYPAIPPQIQQSVHAATGIPLQHIHVSDLLADDMEYDPVSIRQESPILDKDFPAADGEQDHVGLKRVESLLKELSKDKHAGEQHKGINDAILAKSAHADAAAKTTNAAPQNNRSPVSDASAKATTKKIKAL